MRRTYQDFCYSVTKQLFDIIDQQGSLLSWQKKWDEAGCNQLPVGSNGLYKGANLFSLLSFQWKIGFKSNKWLTFNQINKQGGIVKKGAKSEVVYFWKLHEVTEAKNNKTKTKPIFKTYSVFNLEQTTLSISAKDSTPHVFQINILDTVIDKLGVSVSHFGNKAYFSATRHDEIIILPDPSRFTSIENYCITLLHELVHWTGTKNRVPRHCFNNYHKDIKARAEEELVAEIGSVLLATHYGIKGELEHHASYVQQWKKLLSEREVMRSINTAAKTFEWIISQNDAKEETE